jgi:hypothetical protein
MTALPIRAPEPTDLIREPSLRRLLGAAIVAGIGAIVLSVAVAGQFVGSMSNLPGAAAADARSLHAAVPWIVALGIVHLVVATGLAAGRELVRMVAAVLTGLVALAAAGAAAMTAAGIDPLGTSATGHPSASGVGILAIAALLYGAASLLAGGSSEA